MRKETIHGIAKGLIKGGAMMLTLAALQGCQNTQKTSETTIADIIDSVVPIQDDSVEAEYIDVSTESDISTPKEFVTKGFYVSSETQTDASGEYELATFDDGIGNYFCATIGDNTLCDELIEKHFYEVHHSEAMTMSLPGIYPEVYSINEIEFVGSYADEANRINKTDEMKENVEGSDPYDHPERSESEMPTLKMQENMQEGSTNAN